MANHRKARTGLLKAKGVPSVSDNHHHNQPVKEFVNKDRTQAHKRPKNLIEKKKSLRKARKLAQRIGRR